MFLFSLILHLRLHGRGGLHRFRLVNLYRSTWSSSRPRLWRLRSMRHWWWGRNFVDPVGSVRWNVFLFAWQVFWIWWWIIHRSWWLDGCFTWKLRKFYVNLTKFLYFLELLSVSPLCWLFAIKLRKALWKPLLCCWFGMRFWGLWNTGGILIEERFQTFNLFWFWSLEKTKMYFNWASWPQGNSADLFLFT